MSKLKKLQNGKTVQISHNEINDVLHNIPNLSHENYNKLYKAHMSGKGVRINLNDDEFAGSGFGSDALRMAKRGAKVVKNNKQLNKYKDQAINQGLNYAVNKAGFDDETGEFVKNMGRKAINKQFDEFAGGNIFNKKLGRKILKNGSKALKVGNKISNVMGYDDLDDMAIDFVTKQTLGRIDPTLGTIASNQLNKLVDKQIEKHGGSMNPYLPKQLSKYRNSGMYSDLSNQVHVGHDAFNSNSMNDPMFDRLKLYKDMKGSGFVVR